MALNCICIFPEGEMPPSMAQFLDAARFLDATATLSGASQLAEVLEKNPVDYLLVSMDQATEVLGKLPARRYQGLRLILFSEKGAFLVESLPSNPRSDLFQDQGFLVPEGLSGNGYWIHLPSLTPLNPAPRRSMFVKADNKIIRLEMEEICFIEAQKDYVVFHLTDTTVRVLSRMKNIAQRLEPHDFIRVHRSYMVRRDRIEAIDGEIVLLRGLDAEVPIGPSYKGQLIKALELI